ncbi:hypothetical protein R3W88_033628 [Solanum pinnatisectum]|uniref:Uncharacterized protein n=1 Tax=Solanum pinnatisectum TaxID=50273 RepID=A0AAV9K0S7_9SOLN|nr:hypothetical protein R3W88_033628 [Solanum pinnatisectum]
MGCSRSTISSVPPYLYGGITIIFLAIFMALIAITCSRCKKKSQIFPSSSPLYKDDIHNQIEMVITIKPKIVVVIAGDNKPSYLASPSLA